MREWLAPTLVTAALLIVALAPATSSAASDMLLKMQGIGESNPRCIDCFGPTMDASGNAVCAICLAGKPPSGTFRIDTTPATFPPSPCKVKNLSGTLEVSWSDGTLSTANVMGKFSDSEAIKLTGEFASTDPTYPGDALKILLENFPPSPCMAARNAITGSMLIDVG